MILNSYNLQKCLRMKRMREQYKNTISIVPTNTIYTLTSDFIEKQNNYVEEVKKIETAPKKKNKKGLPVILDLDDLHMI